MTGEALTRDANEPGRCYGCRRFPEPETRVGFRGSDKWLLAVLTELGASSRDAQHTLRAGGKKMMVAANPGMPGWGVGLKGRSGWRTMVLVVCPECAAKLGVDVGTKEDGEVPCYDEAWKSGGE